MLLQFLFIFLHSCLQVEGSGMIASKLQAKLHQNLFIIICSIIEERMRIKKLPSRKNSRTWHLCGSSIKESDQIDNFKVIPPPNQIYQKYQLSDRKLFKNGEINSYNIDVVHFDRIKVSKSKKEVTNER